MHRPTTACNPRYVQHQKLGTRLLEQHNHKTVSSSKIPCTVQIEHCINNVKIIFTISSESWYMKFLSQSCTIEVYNTNSYYGCISYIFCAWWVILLLSTIWIQSSKLTFLDFLLWKCSDWINDALRTLSCAHSLLVQDTQIWSIQRHGLW